MMTISPDNIILFWIGHVAINATVAYTWVIMFTLSFCSWLITSRMTPAIKPSHWQMLLESLVVTTTEQIESISHRDPLPLLPFVGTLFIFILVANIFSVIPGYKPPTGSLSTTAALAIAVFIAVPVFGVHRQGGRQFLKRYIEPTPLMLPFNIMGDISRTVALAVRLYGNVMSGTVIAAILLTLAPFVFPVLMQLLGLVTGVIQAWIFAILATVYIASANETSKGDNP